MSNIRKMLVIGDLCQDIFMYCKSTRLCPDAPVPIVEPMSDIESMGMSGNVYNNILSIATNVQQVGINLQVSILANKERVEKLRVVDEKTNHMFVRIDKHIGAVQPIDLVILEEYIKKNKFDIVLISDYSKGFIPNSETIEAIVKLAKTNNCLVLVDTKKLLDEHIFSCDFVKINNVEYEYTNNIYPELLKKNISKLIITRGRNGCDYNGTNYPVEDVDVKDMTGAGDTFMSALGFSLVFGNPVQEAIKFANMCASIVVQKKGVSVPFKTKDSLVQVYVNENDNITYFEETSNINI